jgi:hypothetical protein
MRPGRAILLLWVGFAISWLAAAAWRGATEKRAGLRAELSFRMVLLVGGLLFLIPAHGYSGPLRLWHVTRSEAWFCVGLIASGFAFSWWARIHLGTLWSSGVTKESEASGDRHRPLCHSAASDLYRHSAGCPWHGGGKGNGIRTRRGADHYVWPMAESAIGRRVASPGIGT